MIPYQEDANHDDPEEHCAWALRAMPSFAGSGFVTHPGFLRSWSKHLWDAGFRHTDWIAGLADENGNIHVSKLPAQRIKMQRAIRGPRHHYNAATPWVPVDTPAPKLIKLPDIRQLTDEENAAILQQYRDAGMLPDNTPKPDMAAEVYE